MCPENVRFKQAYRRAAGVTAVEGNLLHFNMEFVAKRIHHYPHSSRRMGLRLRSVAVVMLSGYEGYFRCVYVLQDLFIGHRLFVTEQTTHNRHGCAGC